MEGIAGIIEIIGYGLDVLISGAEFIIELRRERRKKKRKEKQAKLSLEKKQV